MGSGERKHTGKTYRVIYGKPKDKPEAGSVEQAYRYPAKTWSESEAREHCQDPSGNFEPATREGGDLAKNKRENYESVDSLIAKVEFLTKQLSLVV
ncbi:MAG: hypothetical protein ACPLIG_05020 [Candidatus Bathyarchaeales archaeon]